MLYRALLITLIFTEIAFLGCGQAHVANEQPTTEDEVAMAQRVQDAAAEAERAEQKRVRESSRKPSK